MNSLFGRILISATLAVFVLCMALWQWFSHSQTHNAQLVQQSLHNELAAHMADINPLLSQGVTSSAALKEAFHDFMLLGPSFEIYTLDLAGNVIAYDAKQEKIKRPQVDTLPLNQFLSGASLPILGQDPRSNNKDKIFSATELQTPSGEKTGYLYVIIGGELFDNWQSLTNEQQQLTHWASGALVSFIFAILLFVLLVRHFTKPIAKLEHSLRSLNKDGEQALALPLNKRAPREITQLTEDINHLLSRIHRQHHDLVNQQQARQEFMLHLSHDLKTPLTSLQGYIDTWLLLPADKQNRELIEVAARAGEQLQQLLSQILQLTALENGQINVHKQAVNLQQLLHDLQQQFAPRAQSQKVELNFHAEPDLVIHSDPQLLTRVLNNLVDNAIRYTPKGGYININLQQHDNQLWLEVTDNGSGMHKHELSALKQLSSNQARLESQHSLPQLGVGLAIVRQLVALLEYDIEIESTPGVGSTFKLAVEPLS
ncbi:sensor histidine kinase [Shewanella waksmanii]|uniref:sensor histidine kinase n=1 Tax=Shewanella waksmanii TaxID=213783 RepID=UPI000491CFD8|nr:HAMP domain-containing sensor histidine kinase [Shewanella waksmanii]